MKKKFSGKLILKKDVISALNNDEMSKVVGGADAMSMSITTPKCVSYIYKCVPKPPKDTDMCVSILESCSKIPG